MVPDILTAILLDNPDMLKSKKTMTHEDIIDNVTGKSLVTAMAHKELSQLDNESITIQLKYISDKFGMELIKKSEHLDQLAEGPC